jgi:hypothetical protein
MDIKDTETCPYDRGDDVTCLNCRRTWLDHFGWLCPIHPSFKAVAKTSAPLFRNKIGMGYQYLTVDMVGCSLSKPATTVSFPKKTIDVSNWEEWAHKVEGECACGIKRIDCAYHKG